MMNDGSVAVVRRAVTAQLDEELAARDEGRAERYVCTVRPAMAALRYVHSADEGARRGPDGGVGEKAMTSHSKEVAASEEGGAVADGVPSAEEGDAPTNTLMMMDDNVVDDGAVSKEGATARTMTEAEDQLVYPELGTEFSDKTVTKLGSMAKVRIAVKRSKREAKQQRGQRARERVAKNTCNDDEVARVIAELDTECERRRQRYANEARSALEVRRQRRVVDGGDEVVERARVNLVQHEDAKVVGNDEGDGGMSVAASDGLPTAVMMVDGVQQYVKIDSGARYSVAGTGWMTRGEKHHVDAPVMYTEGIGGFLLDVLGVWTFSMTNVYGQTVTIDACIVEGCTGEFLVGVDFLEMHRATVDFDRGEVRYPERNHEVIIPFRTTKETTDSAVAAVRLASATNLHRRAVQTVEVAIAAPDGEEGVFLPTVNHGVVLLAAAVTKVTNGKAMVPAINTYGGRIKLPSRKELGVWIPITQDMELLTMHGELDPERVNTWLDELGDANTPLDDEHDVNIGTEEPSTRMPILKLLRACRDLANAQDECPPATTLNVEHHIDTGDAAPIMMRRRRQAQTEDAIVDSNVDSMLSAGVIEHGEGAWGFPVVLVRKKDGSVRFCVDYRALNSVTRKDVYPLPRIDETLESLGGSRLFTTLDLGSGYWQIRVAEEDRDKTAFMTKRGLYRLKRMPFGLTNAPATFQRLMNGVLRGLTWMTCLVYLDDIIIFMKGGIERHVVELAGVLERLRSAGLSLKLKKCTFATTSMEYLGHHLSNQGVQPAERLVRSVREFPRPVDATEVKRFVHLAGYYRKFIAAFGSIVEPLTRLLKKDV
ncbi:hypothetical protein PR002_g13466 [Phytophthora rubi]|uniref:Reverse transcriptase domain-containing protein n=1 Tax=Phytophthora rubi TaxID=129364 RepID=A0A6A3LGK3_9STRA|nr:hypothetical protein PR002_g13466 [Phytophthora rubi]